MRKIIESVGGPGFKVTTHERIVSEDERRWREGHRRCAAKCWDELVVALYGRELPMSEASYL